MSIRNTLARLVESLWRAMNALRRILHLILLLFVFGLLLAGLVGAPVRVPASAALVVDPEGELVEQLAGDPLERALGELQGDGVRQALVKDIVDSLESAVNDDRIKAVVLRLELLDAGALPKLQAVARALTKVRDAGKKVIALGDSFDQGQYYLAAHADEIYLNDLGMVYIDGFGYYRTFLKGALDKLRVDLNVFRVGEYKSFVEPFTRDDMSEEDKTASRQWLQSMWAAYQRDVVSARKLDAGSIDDYANNFAAYLQAADGSASRLALDRRLVDELMDRQKFREYMVAIVGEADGDDTDYSQIDYRSYLNATRRVKPPEFDKANVGVIVAAGQIVDGEAPPGAVGGDTLSELIRQAAEDESVKAVVLRVDSPGGSMFASEVVLDELRALQSAGKPLVVSMGSLAASGGYYISMFADEIWASESTITGSIGVGALVPTFDRGLDALGIHVDGIGTTRLAGQMRLDRPLGEEARQILDSVVRDAYRIFVSQVADARKMEFAEADEIARGRVWIGSDAQQLGLVDTLGDLGGAIEAAARRANLEADAYGVRYIEPDLSWPERLFRDYAVRLLGNLARAGIRLPSATNSPLRELLAAGERELASWQALNDPRGLYYLCSCLMR
jgi:protease-4